MGNVSTDVFEKILASTQSTNASIVRLEERLNAHMANTDRRFDELQKRDREICTFRHNEVNGKLEDLYKLKEDVRDETISRLESALKEHQERAKTSGNRSFEWKKYAVSATVGVIMLLLSSVISYHVSKASSPARKNNTSSASSVIM